MSAHWQTARGRAIERWILATVAQEGRSVRELAEAGKGWRISQAGIQAALLRLVDEGRIRRSATKIRRGKGWPAWVWDAETGS